MKTLKDSKSIVPKYNQISNTEIFTFHFQLKQLALC